MGKALDADKVDLYVDLFSIWSCMGRLIAGYGSDMMLRRGIPRPVCLAFAYLSLMAGCLLLATGSIEILYVGSALVGLAYGAFWSLFPCIISEVFGFKQFAAIYKTIVSTGPIGAYLLSAKLVGYLYDREVLYYHKKFPDMVWNNDDENTCYGQRCFGFSLLLLALVCLSGATVCLSVLTMRTRQLYQRLQLK
jgi:MFS family permease